MKTKILILALATIFMSAYANAQDFQKPSEGKAVVYFLRTSGLGAAINFKFFDNDTYLGKFKGKNYVKQEFEPGKHLFWAKSENLDFMEADLLANKIYLVQVKPKMGGMKAAVKLNTVDTSDSKLMEKIKKMISKKGPVELSMKKAEKVTPKINEYLQKYEKLKNGEEKEKIKILSSEMFFE